MENILEKIINVEDDLSDIINKLDNYIGLNNAKEVIENIKKYYEVYGINSDEQFKNYNIIISIRSEYDLYSNLIQIIKQMYMFLRYYI